MTKEERRAAFENYRVEIVDGRIYAVVTVDFGRKRGEIHLQDMYQRLLSEKDPVRKYWHGTMLGADHEHAKCRTKEQRRAAFANYRIETVDDRIYAVATINPHQDMYQRLTSDKDTIGSHWYGTQLAADHKYVEREARMKRLREARRE